MSTSILSIYLGRLPAQVSFLGRIKGRRINLDGYPGTRRFKVFSRRSVKGNVLAQGTSKHAVLMIAVVSSFLTPFTSAAINIALPTIGQELSMDAVSLNWVATAYLLPAATFLMPLGRLADILGRKKVLQIGIVVDALAAILCALAPSGGWLIAFRALQGLGGSMMFGNSAAILSSVFPPNERGRALGLTVASVYTGLTVGPLIGGVLTHRFGWQAVFLVDAILGVVITAVVFTRLKGEWAEAKGEPFDILGSMLYCTGMVVLIYALSVLPAVWGFGLIAVALAAIGAFVRWEARQQFPLIRVELFRDNAAFALSNLAALINYSATFAVGLLLSLYLQYIGGYTPESAGLLLIAQPIMMVICSPIAGHLSDRIAPRTVSSVGMALSTVGLAMLAFLGASVNLPWIVASLVVLGTGFGFFSSPNANAIMGSVDRKYYGVASGMMGTMRLTGQALSLGVVLLLFSVFIGRVAVTPANHEAFLQAMRAAFIFSAAICFLGIFASAARGRGQGPGR